MNNFDEEKLKKVVDGFGGIITVISIFIGVVAIAFFIGSLIGAPAWVMTLIAALLMALVMNFTKKK